MKHIHIYQKGLVFIALATQTFGLLGGVAHAEPVGGMAAAAPAANEVEKVPVRVSPVLPADTNASVAVDPATSGLDQKSLNNAIFLLQIQNELKKAYADYHNLDQVIGQSQSKITKTRDTLGTLRDQIISFQNEISLNEEKIKNVATQVGLKSDEIRLLEEEIVSRSIALDQQKTLLADYMRMMYIQENVFRDSGGLSPTKLLLADGDIGATLGQMQTLDMLQHSGQDMLVKLRDSQNAIAKIQDEVQVKKAGLDALSARLLAQRGALEDQKTAKAQLLESTHNDEQTYQKLIAESQQQQDESVLQINALQGNFNYIKENLSKLGNSVSPTDLQKLLDERTRSLYAYQQQSDKDSTLQWPVNPSRGISAYFHDSAYRAHFGVNHQAIDIPTSQASAIHAPKDGYVYKVRDNGMGYSYIILSHKDNIMTVYGHVSSILVKEGQFVGAGSVIGLTGGMPGTKGAGYMTTGPHLHFEVHLRGVPVDPLDYLSLTKLPLEDLPTKYAQRVEAQQALAVRDAGDAAGVSAPQDPVAAAAATAAEAQAAEKIKQDVVNSAELSGQNEMDAYKRIFGE